MTDEKNRGPKGNLGTSTPGSRLKDLWKAHPKRLSLKLFVKTLKDNPDVKVWLANKAGKNETPRTDTNKQVAKAAGQSTKLAKKKSKKSGVTTSS